jgi:maltooligosyltrehalose trehalohydrolase
MMKYRHVMPFGAQLDPQGATFRLWAPSASKVELLCDDRQTAMQPHADGWFQTQDGNAKPGTRYAFRIDGDLVVPDPASRSNPDDVHQRSELTDPLAFEWPDDGWRNRPWHEAVIYELHVGTFTPEGTFTAAVDKFDDLVAIGITALELMPIADFPGARNWGYDGVLPFAPDTSYGTPDDFKRLVAAAHARGLMVLLDVVYNHFGPDGNYLHAYAKPWFDGRQHTPWGAAIDFSQRPVREFFVHNALYWLEEFRLDGLRLDAVHAIADDTFVDELCARVRAGIADRPVHLVLENDRNEARRLQPGLASAQWNDDFHHAAQVLATGERDGYYVDYAERPVALLGRALAEGFAYQGEPSPYRDGERRGERSTALTPLAFDQVGNRALGERLSRIAEPHALRALTACLLLAPAVPMLFMGEEWVAATPFLFFCDFTGDLAAAVTNGRRAEFARFERFAADGIPDPNDARTFAASKLDWSERGQHGHARHLALVRELLRLRRERLVPLLPQARSGRFALPARGVLHVEWPLGGAGGRWHLQANLSSATVTLSARAGDTVYASHDRDGAPWSVRVTHERP